MLFMPLQSFSQEPIPVILPRSSPLQVNIFDSLPPQEFNVKCLIGDYWSKNNGPHFENFRLYSDGTFKITTGYSGGIFHAIDVYGTYFIDENNNTLRFKIKDFEQRGNLTGKPKIRKRDVGSDVEIVGFNDTIVVVHTTMFDMPATKVYRRSPGIMKNQNWSFPVNDRPDSEMGWVGADEEGWEHFITFKDHGQFTYSATNSELGENSMSLKFMGTYHLYNDRVYLTVSHKDAYDAEVGRTFRDESYTERCAYIRVDPKNERINLSDMRDIINDNLSEKRWRYLNCEFVTDHPIPDSLNEQWVNMCVIVMQ